MKKIKTKTRINTETKHYFMVMDGRARFDPNRSMCLCTADTLEEAIKDLELFAGDSIIFKVDIEGEEEPTIAYDPWIEEKN